MSTFTPGRMKHASLMGSITVGPRDEAIFHCGLGLRHGNFGYEQVENARRLVACWNALEGIPTEEVESVQINGKALKDVAATCLEMLAALRAMVESYEHEASIDNPALLQARAAIAKATQ